MSGSFTYLSLTNAANQLVVGPGPITTINCPTPLSDRNITIPDPGVFNSRFILQDYSSPQTINSGLNVAGSFKFGSTSLVGPVAARTLTVPDPYISTFFLLCTIVSLTNTTPRPLIQNFDTNPKNSWEIRGISQTDVHNDDGFLRLRAGGGTNAGNAAYIDLSGSSTVADMDKNIVFGIGSEVARINSAGLSVTSVNSPSVKSNLLNATNVIAGTVNTTSINLPVTTMTAGTYGPFGTSANIKYQVTGGQVTLTIYAIGGTASRTDVIFVGLPSIISSPDVLNNIEFGTYLFQNGTGAFQIGLWHMHMDPEYGTLSVVLTAGLSSAYTSFTSGLEYHTTRFTITYLL